jgi:hypothetical protein
MGRHFVRPTGEPTRIINLKLPESMYLFIMREATRRGTSLTQVLRDMIADEIQADA